MNFFPKVSMPKRKIDPFFCLFPVLAFLLLVNACSSLDNSQGTIPRNNVREIQSAANITIFYDTVFHYGDNPLTRRSVILPAGDYILECEDNLFLYFRSGNPLEYRIQHKEGFSEGFFQHGGLAFTKENHLNETPFYVCTYTDGNNPHQKLLTCPLDFEIMMQKYGIEWDGDFTRKE